MKTAFNFFAIIFCFILFAGCSKTDVTPLTKEEQIAKYLTGDGNKYWHLKKVYQNAVEQTLTTSQRNYTKTYTIGIGETQRGKFTNSDGYTGTWTVLNQFQVYEEFNGNPRGGVPLTYKILSITDTTLDIEYLASFITTREVYYAF